MALQEPVAVYNAASNIEAQLVRNILNDAGVEAFVTEDVSQVGVWMFGLLPEIHKPQVWVDRSSLDRAKPVLEDYERRSLERQEADRKKAGPTDAVMEAECEECGRRSAFPSAQKGTVQDCPHCGAYMDVEEPLQATLVTDSELSEVEKIRRDHLHHEAAIQAIGYLYYFDAVIVVLIWLFLAFGPHDSGSPKGRIFYGSIYFTLFVTHMVLAAGLRRLAAWARWPVGILSCVELVVFPVGTVINAYLLYLFFSQKGGVVLSNPYQQVIANTPHLKPRIARVFWILFAIMVVPFILVPLLMVGFIFLPMVMELMRF